MAGSSVTLTTHEFPAPSVGRIELAAVGDDTNGTYPTFTMPVFDGRILSITTNPGTTAPDADYDIVLHNADGFDILGTAGIDRHTSTTERAAVTNGYVSRHETTTLVITGNTAVDATTQVILHYTQRPS